MKQLDHSTFKKLYDEKKIAIGIEPSLARRFYQEYSTEKIGVDITKKSILMKFILLLHYLSLVFNIIISIIAVRYYSILIIPVIIIITFFATGQASIGKQQLSGAIIIQIIFFVISFQFASGKTYLLLWIITLPLPYFFAKLEYKLSTHFLRNLVLKNSNAYHLLFDNAIFYKYIY